MLIEDPDPGEIAEALTQINRISSLEGIPPKQISIIFYRDSVAHLDCKQESPESLRIQDLIKSYASQGAKIIVARRSLESRGIECTVLENQLEVIEDIHRAIEDLSSDSIVIKLGSTCPYSIRT